MMSRTGDGGDGSDEALGGETLMDSIGAEFN